MPQPLSGQPQQQLTQPMRGTGSQQTIPIFGPFREPVATMQTNAYSGQDVRAEDWAHHGPHEPWVQDTRTWNDPPFRGRRGRAMAVRGIGRGARGRARQEANWVPFDERPYIQPPSPLRPQAPPYVPLQTQQQQLPPPVYTVPPLGVPAGNHPQQVTPEAVAEMIQAALTQRDVPPMPLLQKPYPD